MHTATQQLNTHYLGGTHDTIPFPALFLALPDCMAASPVPSPQFPSCYPTCAAMLCALPTQLELMWCGQVTCLSRSTQHVGRVTTESHSTPDPWQAAAV